MSFILDALKKSEIERQRQAVPGLMESAMPPPRSDFPLWAVALVALLAINLAVLAIVLTRNGTPAPAPASTSRHAPAPVAPAASSVPAAAPPTPQHFSPQMHRRSTRPDTGGCRPRLLRTCGRRPSAVNRSPAGAARAPRERESTAPAVAERNPAERDPILTAKEDKSDQEVLPTINELSLSGRQALPDLHLDVHVFATNPAERFSRSCAADAAREERL